MSYYDNDYSDEMYDRYMLTGEGAEYFEDFTEEDDDVEENYINQRQTNIAETEVTEYKDLNEQLDDVIRYLKQQLKEKERIIKAQNKTAKSKKKSTKKSR